MDEMTTAVLESHHETNTEAFAIMLDYEIGSPPIRRVSDLKQNTQYSEMWVPGQDMYPSKWETVTERPIRRIEKTA